MSLYVEGVLAPSVIFNGSPRTYISLSFFARLRRSDLGQILLTTNVPGHQPFSFTLPFLLAYSSAFDVSLGLDWSSLTRESLLLSGLRVDSTLDPWQFLSNPLHPLSGMSSLVSAAYS